MEHYMPPNKKIILRLSRYRRVLIRFKKQGYIKTFSESIAGALSITPAQVRKDFSIFNVPGNKKGGYHIDTLLTALNSILYKDHTEKVVLAGLKSVGNHLLKNGLYLSENIRIAAAFDKDPSVYQENGTIPVLPISSMEEYIRENGIRIGVVGVADIPTQQIVDMMVLAGIRGILNFSPFEIHTPSWCFESSVNLMLELENLLFFIADSQSSQKKRTTRKVRRSTADPLQVET
jgi:redox-sensing transcriptional repressor